MRKEEIANTPSDDFYGMPPKIFYIDFGYGDKRKIGIFIKDPLETYKFENGTIKKVKVGTKNQTKPFSGMYFLEGSGTIGIDKKNNCAFLSFAAGPRYGQGLRYDIIDGKEGKELGEEHMIWMS